MAKNPLITDDVKRVIAEMYLNHSNWRAKEIRDGVEARLHEKNPRSKPGWPGLSAVQKELTKQRKTDDARQPESKELDKPWNLGTLSQYELPPDAVPIVLFIGNHKWFRLDIDGKEQVLTIREAKWIARLYALLPGYGKDDPNSFYELQRWAQEYALQERLTELSGIQTTSSKAESLEDWVFITSEVIRKYEADGNTLLPPINPPDGARHEAIESLFRKASYYSAKADAMLPQITTVLPPNTRFVDAELEAAYIREIAQKYGADPVKLQDLKGKSVGEIEEAAKSGKYQREAQNER